MNYKQLIQNTRQQIAKMLGKTKGEKFLNKCATYDQIAQAYGISEGERFLNLCYTKEKEQPQEKEQPKERKKSKERITVYVYGSDGTLIEIFPSLGSASFFILGKFQGVRKHFIGKVYHGYLLSGQMLTQEQAREIYMSADRILPRGRYKRKGGKN